MPLGNLQASICSVMVTGSCGFIGANLVRDLLRRFPNMRVCGVDRLDYNAMDPAVAAPGDPAERARLRFVRADICDRERMLELLRPVWQQASQRPGGDAFNADYDPALDEFSEWAPDVEPGNEGLPAAAAAEAAEVAEGD